MAAADYSVFTILPFRSVLAVGRRIPLCPTDFGHGLIVCDNELLEDKTQTEVLNVLLWFGLPSRFCHLP